MLVRQVHANVACWQGGEGAAVIRGPIASRVINQLIANTTWGELDYLVRAWLFCGFAESGDIVVLASGCGHASRHRGYPDHS